MAHADDSSRYEGPPCDWCRTSQFIGTCTHRPLKRNLDNEKRIDDMIELVRQKDSPPPIDALAQGGKTIHELKCWPEYFHAIRRGDKSFEVRKGNDRIYRVGDKLHLLEWDPEMREYTQDSMFMDVVYVMHGPPFLPEDVWVLGLSEGF